MADIVKGCEECSNSNEDPFRSKQTSSDYKWKQLHHYLKDPTIFQGNPVLDDFKLGSRETRTKEPAENLLSN